MTRAVSSSTALRWTSSPACRSKSGARAPGRCSTGAFDGYELLDPHPHPRRRSDFLDGPIGKQQHRLVRTVVDVARGRATSAAPLSARICEFPRMDPRRFAAPHRFVYAAASRHPTRSQPFQARPRLTPPHAGGDRDSPPPAPQAWVKVDAGAAREVGVHDFGFHTYAGEPEFVPRAAGAEEDDGWLVGLAYDARRNASAFVVVETRGMTRVATAWLQHHLPPGLHGTWTDTYFGPPPPPLQDAAASAR